VHERNCGVLCSVVWGGGGRGGQSTVLYCTVLYCKKSVYVLHCMCAVPQCAALHSMQGREKSLRQINPERRRDGVGLGLDWPSCVQ